MQEQTDRRNAAFWDEMCGSLAAKTLGITDASPASLKKYDSWYLEYYPYLLNHVPVSKMRGRSVLEIGLGYGTLSQTIIDAGAFYTGLDIASGPVQMVNARIAQTPGVIGEAIQGSILDPQLAAGSFDHVIAIGSLHHTGNLQLAISRCHELLKPGGKLHFMVYNAYSFRRFVQDRAETLRYLRAECLGYRGVVGGDERSRGVYDANIKGESAPHTDFISRRSLKKYCRPYRVFSSRLDNIEQEPPFRKRAREDLLKSRWPRLCGLDIYATAEK